MQIQLAMVVVVVMAGTVAGLQCYSGTTLVGSAEVVASGVRYRAVKTRMMPCLTCLTLFDQGRVHYSCDHRGETALRQALLAKRERAAPLFYQIHVSICTSDDCNTPILTRFKPLLCYQGKPEEDKGQSYFVDVVGEVLAEPRPSRPQEVARPGNTQLCTVCAFRDTTDFMRGCAFGSLKDVREYFAGYEGGMYYGNGIKFCTEDFCNAPRVTKQSGWVRANTDFQVASAVVARLPCLLLPLALLAPL